MHFSDAFFSWHLKSYVDSLYFSLPSFQGLNNMNSSSLPASFVLVLPHPVPVSLSIINAIEEMTGKVRVQ